MGIGFTLGVAVMLVTELVLILLRGLAWDLPAIIVLTTVALLMAQLPSGTRIACYDMGLVLIQPFFAVIGLSTTVGGLFGLIARVGLCLPGGCDPGAGGFVRASPTALGLVDTWWHRKPQWAVPVPRWRWPAAWADRRWCCLPWRSVCWE